MVVIDSLNGYLNAMPDERFLIVQLHEFGHLLGLTDLYDESGRYAGLYLSWMGAWDYDDFAPLPDAESRFRLRWANWHQVQGRQSVRISPVESSGQVYRLGVGDEYFLVENRGPEGAFDRALPERGLAIFHVDRRVKLGGEEGSFVNRLVDCVSCDPWHPYIRLLQADGKFEIENDGRFGRGDLFVAGAALSGEATNWYSGEASGVSITVERVNDDGSIDVVLEAPSEGQCGDQLCEAGDGCRPLTCGVQEEPEKPGCATVPFIVLPLALLAGVRRARSAR